MIAAAVAAIYASVVLVIPIEACPPEVDLTVTRPAATESRDTRSGALIIASPYNDGGTDPQAPPVEVGPGRFTRERAG